MSDPNDETVTTDTDVDTEAAALAVDMGGNKMVPLSALIAAKKEGKTHRDKVKELEPIAARAASIDERLTNAQPYIDALVNNPKLKAEALRAVNGTRTSSETTLQPDANEDPDATDFAEDMGMYLPDGQTPDVARARRALTRLDQRHGKQTDERIRPLAGVTLNRQANDVLRGVYGATDDDGVPIATAESIKEVVDLMKENPALLANPQVGDMVLNMAAGLDRRKGRTPKAPEEPLYLASPGGGRHSNDGALDSEMRAFAKKFGIDEKEATSQVQNLERGVQSRKGVTFGGNK